jgi:hypothetical protein
VSGGRFDALVCGHRYVLGLLVFIPLRQSVLQPWFNDLRKDYRLVLLVAVDLPFMLDFLADILGHRCVQIPNAPLSVDFGAIPFHSPTQIRTPTPTAQSIDSPGRHAPPIRNEPSVPTVVAAAAGTVALDHCTASR